VHSPGHASQAREPDRDAPASCLAAAQPGHPCPVVRSVRRDHLSRRKNIRPHPLGLSAKASSNGGVQRRQTPVRAAPSLRGVRHEMPNNPSPHFCGEWRRYPYTTFLLNRPRPNFELHRLLLFFVQPGLLLQFPACGLAFLRGRARCSFRRLCHLCRSSIHRTSSGVSTPSISRLNTRAFWPLRANTHCSCKSGLGLIS
jgi:hypothetical protein